MIKSKRDDQITCLENRNQSGLSFLFFRIPLRYDMKYNKKKNKGEFIQVVSKAVSYSEEQHYTISISSNDLLKGK